MGDRIDETAHAKVNLTLEVLGRRSDGFHELRSLVAFARDCGDGLSFDAGAPVGVCVEGPFAGAIAGENLLARTLANLAALGTPLQLGRVRLDKRLPVAAGIGGGSADAAALLRAVRRANPYAARNVDWHGLAASVGSDVPVCLESRPCLMEGVGDRLTPFAMPGPLCAVLANPMSVVPVDKTKQVFRALARPVGRSTSPTSRSWEFSTTSELLACMSAAGNSLIGPALCVMPEIASVLAALKGDARCRLASLSGAGPTCFGIYADMVEAREAAATLAARHSEWWVCATVLG